MLQRIQTVYWLVSIVILGVMIFLPLFVYEQGEFLTVNCTALTITIITTATLTAFAIFLYKNRRLQVRMGYCLIFLHFLIYFFIGAHYHFDKGIQFLPWAGLPLVSLLLHILAIRAVKKDEALIKSMDRLR